MTERDNLLNDIYFQVDIQEHLANKYNKTPSYISQLAKFLKQLEYPPTIKDGKLICANCEKSHNNLMFYRNYKTNQLIILICKPCNLKLKIKDLGGNILYKDECINSLEDKKNTILRERKSVKILYDVIKNYTTVTKKLPENMRNAIIKIEERINNEYIE